MQDKKCNDIHKRDLQKMIWSLGGLGGGIGFHPLFRESGKAF